ncbi:TetR/AcrR family transcriptional regulator [Lentibacter algarum]|uniref:TetR/AcrR family transcriptional regulator n=1 Tax=Lentibacter algarum TaxID=576131 RepID=UPI001C06DF5A|nr:TetR/AcrR family transcriptional regulator [Lentibacter algarum]MBU2981781.1 TetR/AcrR family transcriptional regulator [Lentibacter algarum]
MKRKPQEEVQTRIVNAVTKVASERGIGGTSMANVAKAARVSAGTLYLHFASKEDMLQKAYLSVKHAFHDKLMQSIQDAKTPEIAIKALWNALLEFQTARPTAFLYLEYAGAAQVLTEAQRAQVAPLQQDVNEPIRLAIEQGTITVSLDIATNLLIGSAMHLARKHALAGTAIPADEADQTYARVWAALTLQQT